MDWPVRLLSSWDSPGEYWSELLCPPPGQSFWPRDQAVSLVSCIGRWGSLPLAPPGKPLNSCTTSWNLAYTFVLLCEVFLVWKIWLQFVFTFTIMSVDIYLYTCFLLGFPCGSAGKESTCNAGGLGWEDPRKNRKATHSTILVWRIPWTIYSPWGCKKSDTTEWLSLSLFYFTLLCMNYSLPNQSFLWT